MNKNYIERDCHRMRSYFMPLVLETELVCSVCHRSAMQHIEGPCAVKQSDFIAPGRCIACGDYTREHRP